MEDDGLEERRSFRLRCTIDGVEREFDVPAARFKGLSWVDEDLGQLPSIPDTQSATTSRRRSNC